jgi:hypothetical protein
VTMTEPVLSTAVRTSKDVVALNDEDRRLLACWLSDCSVPDVLPQPVQRRRKRVLLTVSISAVVLVPWVAYLAIDLPQVHRAREWRVVWVGFDIALILAFAASAWLGWRGRQLVLPALLVTGVLLLCDAWFDVVLSWGDKGQVSSVFALVFELPLAMFLIAVYHRLLKTLTAQMWRDRGLEGEPPPLRRTPLLLRTERPKAIRLD